MNFLLWVAKIKSILIQIRTNEIHLLFFSPILHLFRVFLSEKKSEIS